MKKMKSFFVAMFLAIMCLFAVACASPTGVYKVKTVTIGDETVAVGEQFEGATQPIPENFFTVELKSDNTMKMDVLDDTEMISAEGTWTQSGTTITLFFEVDGEAYEVTAQQSGNELTINYFGSFTVVLSK